MMPIDAAWSVLKRQTKLYNWIWDYPNQEPIKYFHGSRGAKWNPKVRHSILQQGLVPQPPRNKTHLTTAPYHASTHGSDLWGIRGEPPNLKVSHPSNEGWDMTTNEIISPEQLVFLGNPYGLWPDGPDEEPRFSNIKGKLEDHYRGDK